jgi:hypothetical protein
MNGCFLLLKLYLINVELTEVLTKFPFFASKNCRILERIILDIEFYYSQIT